MVLLLQIRKLRLREGTSVARGQAGLLIGALVPSPASATLPLRISSSASHPVLPYTVFSSGFYSSCLDSMFFFVFGEKKKIYSTSLHSNQLGKSLNAIADVQLKNVKFVALTFCNKN